MGNYASCTLSGPVSKSFIRGTKVIFPSGEVRRLYHPTKAAELMLEVPGFFISEAKCLRIGKRLAALAADEDLEIGGVYVFFPMKRLNSAVTAADMGRYSWRRIPQPRGCPGSCRRAVGMWRLCGVVGNVRRRGS
ncbi:UNVERIFIED_CONTAM: hypothetical protein Sangu_0207600 [Sesamum angustifolium]|uniref:Uncharacterized protein n=1 Tax=Sesamum angustifolium TaxID=2727405 RepID=A0AAW2RMV5_9LAMI